MILILIFLLFFNIPSVYAATAEEYVSVGNDDFKIGRFDQAIVDYSKAIETDPNDAKAYNNRGVAYAQERSFPRAIADFTIAIAINPKDADPYNNRGHAYAERGDFSQAIFDYGRAIDTNMFYVKAYNNRELAYYALKEYDKAWSDVHTAQAVGGAVDPDFLKELKTASGQEQ